MGDMDSAARYLDGECNLPWLIIHQHHVGGLDGSIASQTAHGDTYVGTLQHWCIVDAIAHVSQGLVRWITSFTIQLASLIIRLASLESFHLLYLVGRQKLRTTFIQAELSSHVLAYLTAIACQHHGLLHAQTLELGDSLCTALLDSIIDDDMTSILSIDGYMDDGSHLFAIVPLGTDALHHLLVAYANYLAVYLGTDSMTSDFFHISHLAAIRCLVRESLTQGCTYRMGSKMLGVSRQVQEDFFLVGIFTYMHIALHSIAIIFIFRIIAFPFF